MFAELQPMSDLVRDADTESNARVVEVFVLDMRGNVGVLRHSDVLRGLIHLAMLSKK